MTNHQYRVRVSKLSLALALALAASSAMAQNTSANLAGRVSGADGQPVAGADVTIVHVESGTVSRATTDASGRYSARGLRVGGPYTVTVSKDGQTDTREGVYLQLAETTQVDETLGGNPTELGTVVVTGASESVFSSTAMGAGTSINNQQLKAFGSIRRDIQDVARLDPRLSQTDKERGEISAGGQNSRYNSITIDSVAANDTFGLEANNLPTLRQPISIDTIDSVQVNIANYDVTQKGYTGANINAVTKSGTNEFHGSVYGVYRNNDMVGDYSFNTVTGEHPKSKFTAFDDETTWGVTFGGPIVKDKLFFFGAYEKFKRVEGAPDVGTSDSSATRKVNFSSVDVATAVDYADTLYGIDVGSLTLPSQKETTVENALAKFDWNINDNHRFSFRYSDTKQDDLITAGIGNSSLSLSSYLYSQKKQITTYVAQLFSDWSDNFSTEAKISFRDYASAPQTNSNLPSIGIQFTSAGNVRNFLNMGTERFRQANELATETWDGYFAGTWFHGDHEIKFGADYERNKVYNLFLESSNGAYSFDCLSTVTCSRSFEAGRPSSYTYRSAVDPATGLPTNDRSIAAAAFTLGNLGVFVQDTWAVNANLTLTFGFRYDQALLNDSPPANALVAQSAVAGVGQFTRQTGGFGYDNTQSIDGQGLFEPRAGFNYTFDTKRQTQLRGGVGLFQGAAATVWMANPFTNNGQTIGVYGCGGSFSNACTAGMFSGDPDNQPRVGTAKQDVDLLDPGLSQPSVWKANLAFDHELPWWGLVATAEWVHTKTRNAIYYQHLNLGAPTLISATDGRELYWNASGLNASCWNASGSVNTANCSGGSAVVSRARSNALFNDVTLARNTKKGGGDSLTVAVSRPMKNDWAWSLAYTYTDATEVNPLTSSRAISNWANRAIFNPNEETEANSAYLVRDRFNGTFNWQHAFFGDYKTEIAVFYEGRKGKPYSWTFNNDANGDLFAGNDLLYIPTAPGSDEVVFRGGAAEEAAFWEFVEAHKELNDFRGKVVKRNSSFSPWTNTFDLRISQQLPGFFEGNKTVIALDIFNVGNLINKKWGQIEEIGFNGGTNVGGAQARSFVNYVGVDAQGRYIYSMRTPESFTLRDNAGDSRWSAQVTVRYEF